MVAAAAKAGTAAPPTPAAAAPAPAFPISHCRATTGSGHWNPHGARGWGSPHGGSAGEAHDAATRELLCFVSRERRTDSELWRKQRKTASFEFASKNLRDFIAIVFRDTEPSIQDGQRCGHGGESPLPI
nr:unnamed protein product [Digitaria exilis]